MVQKISLRNQRMGMYTIIDKALSVLLKDRRIYRDKKKFKNTFIRKNNTKEQRNNVHSVFGL